MMKHKLDEKGKKQGGQIETYLYVVAERLKLCEVYEGRLVYRQPAPDAQDGGAAHLKFKF